ncbi:MAG TPA: hypothetical protein VHD57_17660 [Vicinamibacterales bacterium]|jgi:hypothetical protein|nr:hypothetical protein [Vicinamibacterales bacterium]
MVFAWLEREVEVGAEEGGAQFGHELLHVFEFFDVLEDVMANRSRLLWGGREGFRAVLGLAIVFIPLGLILLGCLPRVVELEEK